MKQSLLKIVTDYRDFAVRFGKAIIREVKFKSGGSKGYKYFDNREIGGIKGYLSKHSQSEVMRDSPVMIDKMREWVLTQKGGKFISKSLGNLMFIISPVDEQNKFLLNLLEVYYNEINSYDLQIFIRANYRQSGEFLAYDYFINDLMAQITNKLTVFLVSQTNYNFEDILKLCLRSRYEKEYFRLLLLCICSQVLQAPVSIFQVKKIELAEAYDLEEEIELADDPFEFLDKFVQLFGDISTLETRLETTVKFLKAIAAINHFENRTESTKTFADVKKNDFYFNEYAAIAHTNIEVDLSGFRRAL